MTSSGTDNWWHWGRPALAIFVLMLGTWLLQADKPARAVAAQSGMPSIPSSVRVLLKSAEESISIGGKVQWLQGQKVLGLSTGATEVALLETGELRLRLNGKARDSQRLAAVPLEGYAIYDGKSYRGRFELYANSGKLSLVNVLPVEQYLYGVVPGEMPSTWPSDALRAQAVAARTYTARRMLDQQDNTWDLLPTVADQVYLGVSAEKPSTNQAVDDTAGEVLLYEGTPIAAQYCSDAGGCTAPGPYDYLQPVYSYAPESKYNRWERQVSLAELAGLAKAGGVEVGKPQTVESENDPKTGHLLKLTLAGDKASWSCSGKELRKSLGPTQMRSTRALLYAVGEAGEPPPQVEPDKSGRALKCFPVEKTQLPECNLVTTIQAQNAKAGLVVVGSGNGHGVGMSQYGAAELARHGWGYRDILLYFYRGVQLARLGAAAEDDRATTAVEVQLATGRP